MTTEQGRIAVGWLIVEDRVMVLTLVALPALAPLMGGGTIDGTAASSGNVALPLDHADQGRRLLCGDDARRPPRHPAVLHYIATPAPANSSVSAFSSMALGVAYGAAKLFGVSFALGAFFAGVILSESPLSQRAANESSPLRDAFAVLFLCPSDAL